jgi:hypothetical protein
VNTLPVEAMGMVPLAPVRLTTDTGRLFPLRADGVKSPVRVTAAAFSVPDAEYHSPVPVADDPPLGACQVGTPETDVSTKVLVPAARLATGMFEGSSPVVIADEVRLPDESMCPMPVPRALNLIPPVAVTVR